MTVEDRNVVDFVYPEADGSAVVLVVSDHLDWIDVERHLRALQEKLLDYVDALADGRVPEALRRPAATPTIDVVVKFPPPETFIQLLKRVEEYGRSLAKLQSLRVSWRQLPTNGE